MDTMTAGDHGRQGDSLYRYPIQVALCGLAVVAGVADGAVSPHADPLRLVESGAWRSLQLDSGSNVNHHLKADHAD